MLPNVSSYESLAQSFKWDIPETFNIGIETCDRWADGSGRRALVQEDRHGQVSTYSFDDLKALSNKLANVLAKAGVGRGDRVGIFVPQSVETAISHLAVYKTGAVAVPLFYLFGPDALEYRIGNCGMKALVTDLDGMKKIRALPGHLLAQLTIYCTDGATEGARPFWDELNAETDSFDPVATRCDDPAILIYTSGTTGKPKGALHAQKVLLGHLPGVEMSHDFFPQPGDLMWTPADWAWIGGLLDVLLPALYHGVPVLARRFEKFEAEAVFDFMSRHQVRNVFLPPTALRMLRSVANPGQRWPLSLRTVASGGESLTDDILQWGKDALGVTINEFYGQTECNVVVSGCSKLFPRKSGTIGKAVPGHEIAIVDDRGEIVPLGTVGNIAIKRPDPVMFLGYWNNPDATAAKYAGDYLLTGDLGQIDAEGYIRYIGRDDDIITSAGYRIGPGPIEECLMKHPVIRLAAVVGVKDEQRTEIVKAFVVPADGVVPSDDLIRSIQEFVRDRLAAHEYPRAIEFVDSLPTTVTGKVVRRALRDAAKT